MKKGKDGAFTITVELETGFEQRFKYLADGQLCHNDEAADKYVHSLLGSENSGVNL
jgi:hypothetical protein